jgi:hypothetical protein
MTEHEIIEQLVAVHTAYVEKVGAQPYIQPNLAVMQSGNIMIPIYHHDKCDTIDMAKGKSLEAVFADAFRIISEIPDLETAAKRTFHKKLAAVIDEGNALSMPKDVMGPLSDGMKALSENLLTYEKGAA